MKRVVILGATGSIGTQTLDIIRQHPTRLQAVGLSAHSKSASLGELGQKYGVTNLVLSAPSTEFPSGEQALLDLVTHPDVDIVVVAIAGNAALLPTLAAIRAGKQIALASKEVLVAAGELVMPLCKDHDVTMTPIDSEHSAIFQCLQGYHSDQIRRLILTASGGPFRGKTRKDLEQVTVEQALNHPTWNMGGKITIDSATLMNKALEIIEAKWLFGVKMDQVEVCVHPQSVVHSLVEFNDGSFLGQLGWPDMRLPIQYALLWPDRVQNEMKPWNPVETPNLTFEPVNETTFPALQLARSAERRGGTMPCTFNAANEEAVRAFLDGHLGFLGIADTVESVMEKSDIASATLDHLLLADEESRALTKSLIGTS